MRLALMTGIAFVFLASTLLLAADPGKPWVRIEGKITSIDPVEKQIVVDGTTVQVTQDTKIVKEQEEIAFDDLELDMTVVATGVMKEDILMARHIRVKCDGSTCTEVEGKITSIDPVEKQIVVDDVKVQVTSDTIIKMKKQIIDFDDLKVGMTVKACGEMEGGVLIANKVCVKYQGR